MSRDDNLRAGDVIIDSTGDWVVLIRRGRAGADEDLWVRVAEVPGEHDSTGRAWKTKPDESIIFYDSSAIRTGINLYDTFTKLKQEMKEDE